MSLSLTGRREFEYSGGGGDISNPCSPRLGTEFTAEPPEGTQRTNAIRKISFEPTADGGGSSGPSRRQSEPPIKVTPCQGALDELAVEAQEDTSGGRTKVDKSSPPFSKPDPSHPWLLLPIKYITWLIN